MGIIEVAGDALTITIEGPVGTKGETYKQEITVPVGESAVVFPLAAPYATAELLQIDYSGSGTGTWTWLDVVLG